MAVFLEGSAKRCFHTTLKLWDQGCLTVLAKVQVRWLFFLRTRYLVQPGIITIMRPSCIGNDRVIWNSNHKYAGRIFTVPESIHFPHIDMTLRICTDGVGWGGAITLNYICTETQIQTQTDTHAHTHTHTSCYATGRSLGLAQWSGAIMFNCTCTGTHIHIMLRYWMFACTYTHTRHATLLDVLLHLRTHTHVMLRYWTFSCACTRTHTHVVLRYWTFSCTCTHSI